MRHSNLSRQAFGRVLFSLAMMSLPALAAPTDPGPDPRVVYGTTNPEAAAHLEAAVQAYDARQFSTAEASVQRALQKDPSCAAGWYWRALILKETGMMEDAEKAARKAIALDPSGQSAVTLNAELALARMYAALKNFRLAKYWYSRVITDDPEGKQQRLGKAYEGLASVLSQEGREKSARLAERLGHVQRLDVAKPGTKTRDPDDDVSQVLFMDSEVPTLKARAAKTSIHALSFKDNKAGFIINSLLTLPGEPYIVGLGYEARKYALIEGGERPRLKTVSTKQTIIGGTVAGNRLFLFTKSPYRIVEVEPESGKERRSWDLGDFGTVSGVVLPSQGLAFFVSGTTVRRLDLESGKIEDLGLPAQYVVADVSERYIYTRYREDELRSPSLSMMAYGYYYAVDDQGDPSALVQYYVTRGKLVLSSVRENAAMIAQHPVVSPDGRWVALPGRGGWTPMGRPDGGRNIPVFAVNDPIRLMFRLDMPSWPSAACFNPVTQQVAGLTDETIHVADLGGPETRSTRLKVPDGRLMATCAWSQDGRYLAVAYEKGGVELFENTIDDNEEALAQEWWKKARPTSVASKAMAVAAPVALSPVSALESFELSDDARALSDALQELGRKARVQLAPEWSAVAPWSKSPALVSELREIVDDQQEGAGVRLYRLRKLYEKEKQAAPVSLALAQALAEAGKDDEAIGLFIKAVHNDAGRTNLTTRGLNALATFLTSRGRDVAAAQSLATSWALDKGQRRIVPPLKDLLGRTHLASALDLGDGPAAPDTVVLTATQSGLPRLTRVAADAPRLSSADLFRMASASIVLLRTRTGSGTGFVVGESGTIVTSEHVVSDVETVDVQSFVFERGAARPGPTFKADVVVRRPTDDLAVLRLKGTPERMKALPIATESPATGERIYAVGNPGFAGQTLDLSISDGIISSRDRTIGNNHYLQHTAPINPGNSGGPLLNEKGEVVGVVCLLARLNSVAFATPVEEIQTLFPSR